MVEYLSPMIAFLRARAVGVVVSGPRNDLPINPSPLPPTCIVQASPGSPDFDNPIKVVTYTLRVYAMSNDAVLAAANIVDDAFYESEVDPVTGLAVGAMWMISASLGSFGGPEIDPVAKWPVLIATAQVDWAGRQLEVV